MGYAPLHTYHDYAQYSDNRSLISDIQCKLVHCVRAIEMMKLIERALYDNNVLSNSCLSLQLLEKNLYDMAVENLTDGVFYAITLSHKGNFIFYSNVSRQLSAVACNLRHFKYV